MTRWLIIGANGQLGHDLVDLLTDDGAGDTVVGMDLPLIDITDPDSIAAALADADPDVVVNAAAYTAVDAAEEDEELATRVNGLGPELLAQALAVRPHGLLIQVSTDYVFDGSASGPYPEDAEPAPRSAYGRSKAAGERAVLRLLPNRGYIVRTAWLYGVNGNNFVRTMLRLERERETVSVVDDQVGQPTWSRDLARAIIALVRSDAPAGTYHGTNSGQTSWFGFTQRIFEEAGADPARVLPTTTEHFPRPAPRPANSVLGHDGWAAAGLTPMRPWQEALHEAFPLLQD